MFFSRKAKRKSEHSYSSFLLQTESENGCVFSSSKCPRKRKQCRQENPLQRPENELIYEYRLNKAAIMELCDLLREDLKPTLCSSRILTVEQQVLISLKLLASGSFQSSAKDNINVAQSTVSCTLSRFMDSLLSKKKEFIYVQDSVYAEEIKLRF